MDCYVLDGKVVDRHVSVQDCGMEVVLGHCEQLDETQIITMYSE